MMMTARSPVLLLLLLVVVGGLFFRGLLVADAIVLPFNHDVTVRAAVYSEASYTSNYDPEISQWSCVQCLKLPQSMRLISPVRWAVSSALTGVHMYAGLARDDTVVVAFRGSASASNWLTNVRFGLSEAWTSNERVHNGFLTAYEAFAAQMFDSVIGPIATNSNIRNFIFTGHSLGGAVVNVFMGHLLWAATNNQLPANHFLHRSNVNVYAITFGSPRTGNSDFSSMFRSRIQQVRASIGSWRVVNNRDPVPRVPGSFFSYSHVIREIYFDADGRMRECSTATGEDDSCSRGNRFSITSTGDHLHPSYLDLFERQLQSLFAQARRRRRSSVSGMLIDGVEGEECLPMNECEATCYRKRDTEVSDDWQKFIERAYSFSSEGEHNQTLVDHIIETSVSTTSDFFARINSTNTMHDGAAFDPTLAIALKGTVNKQCLNECTCLDCRCDGFKKLSDEESAAVGVVVAAVVCVSLFAAVVLYRKRKNIDDNNTNNINGNNDDDLNTVLLSSSSSLLEPQGEQHDTDSFSEKDTEVVDANV
eukprot:m.38227 g.38227  ORF g.38227 m.38227 type:complete len:535 (+) comp10193_c1_seq1:145-1749(+)